MSHNDLLRAADWIDPPDMVAHFEELAEQFRRETGLFAPGKDAPLGAIRDDELEKKRRDVWEGWLRRKRQALAERLRHLAERPWLIDSP